MNCIPNSSDFHYCTVLSNQWHHVCAVHWKRQTATFIDVCRYSERLLSPWHAVASNKTIYDFHYDKNLRNPKRKNVGVKTTSVHSLWMFKKCIAFIFRYFSPLLLAFFAGGSLGKASAFGVFEIVTLYRLARNARIMFVSIKIVCLNKSFFQVFYTVSSAHQKR